MRVAKCGLCWDKIRISRAHNMLSLLAVPGLDFHKSVFSSTCIYMLIESGNPEMAECSSFVGSEPIALEMFHFGDLQVLWLSTPKM